MDLAGDSASVISSERKVRSFCSFIAGEHALDLLKRDEHDDIPAAETHEICCEAFVERKWALFGNHAAYHSRNRLSTSGLSIHNSRLEHIDWRADTNSDETCAKRARNVRDETVRHANAQSHLFKLVVGGELGRVDDRVAHNVGTNSDPEAADTVLLNRLLIAVHAGGVGSISRWKLALSLHANLDQIRRICN